MARPKKNVEETKEIKKRKVGRPKKMSKKVDANFDNLFKDLEEQLKSINSKIEELDKTVTDINNDLNTICDDIYCDCEEEKEDKVELEKDTTEETFTKSEVEEIIRILNFLQFNRELNRRLFTPNLYVYRRFFF